MYVCMYVCTNICMYIYTYVTCKQNHTHCLELVHVEELQLAVVRIFQTGQNDKIALGRPVQLIHRLLLERL